MPIISGEQFFGGKPGQVVQDAFGATIPSPAKKPGLGSELKSRLSTTAKNIGRQFRGEDEFAGQSTIRRATGITAEAFSAPLGMAKDVLPEAAEKSLEKVGEVVGKGLQWVAEKTTPQFMTDFVTKYPDAAKALEEAAGTVANVGAIAGDILGIQAGATAASKVAQATTKAAITAGEAAAPVTRATGRVLKRAGEGAYATTIIPEEGTRMAVQAYQANQGSLWNRVKNIVQGREVGGKPVTEASTAARKGLVGTEWRLGVQAKQVADDLWKNTIAPKLESVKGQVNMKDFFTQVEKEIRKSTKELSRRNAQLEALEALREEFKSVGKVNLPKLQAYKEGWAEFIPEATYKGKPIASALKDVKNIAAEKARQTIYKFGGEEIKQAYLDYGNLKSIMKAGVKSVGDPAKKGISRNVWEFVMDKAITPVATAGGKILYRTGEGLEFVGKKGAKKVRDAID